MQDIAIYGFGGFGREIACVLNAINKINSTWHLIGYFDDGVKAGTANRYGKVLGNMDTLNSHDKRLAVILAIASPSTIALLTGKINNSNIYFPNIIAPNVLFFDRDSFSIGIGNYIGFGGRISCDVSMENFNFLNGCVSLGHDVSLKNFNMLQPDVRISGETAIGDSNFFGVRSTVLQGLNIGNEVRIGVNSVVMRNTKDGFTYFGNPAKIIKDI
ncbi:serine acetyltransferase [Microbacter margulisiae]|uniref:Sugar O-acyltransferase (Sialic acid O-acetyltransferase NeuD family) n=1 Tax=Microbacter margulisiae TaxID=1350067 RepID=A0A7W5DN35_9PORP|nr:serine acetyltransferase [Microbacter margulisiae]MBB3185967.1 sugar O-acyltransferase (sialic acid O-acetyltransferase NeuD family) [Microbacter margulisiae]